MMRWLLPLALCAISVATAATPESLITDMAYVSPARLVDIGHGRKMNLLCVGHGSPTVIFDSGLGDQIRAWATVQPAIGKITRACSYDRAGLGFSSPSGREGTSENAVEDLHGLLRAASIKPPYVLVGHSLGGMYVRLYADKYLAEVAGMVLVDPVSEEQGRRYHALDPTTLTADTEFVDYLHDQCIPAAAKGFEQGSEPRKKCVGEPDERFSAAFNRSLLATFARPQRQRAVWSEWVNLFDRSSDQVRAAKREYGDLPLIVLTRIPQPKGSQEMRDAKIRLWMELHDEIARLSTRGVNRVVADAGHYIQFDKPEAVIDAIREVVQSTTAR
jgi:pimeloyl-ACP methyl ester carboxylesterase